MATSAARDIGCRCNRLLLGLLLLLFTAHLLQILLQRRRCVVTRAKLKLVVPYLDAVVVVIIWGSLRFLMLINLSRAFQCTMHETIGVNCGTLTVNNIWLLRRFLFAIFSIAILNLNRLHLRSADNL